MKAPPNEDIMAGFFRFVREGGKDVLTFNLQVAKLDRQVPAGANFARWPVSFGFGERTGVLTAVLNAEGNDSYRWSVVENKKELDKGPTTGRFYEGEKGIIEIVVPVGPMGLAGRTLKGPTAKAGWSFERVKSPTPAVGSFFISSSFTSPTTDVAPDGDGKGVDFQALPCVGGKTVQPVETPKPPPPDDKRGKPVPPPDRTGAPRNLGLRVLTRGVSARRVARVRRVDVRLRAAAPVTDLRGRLLAGRGAGRVVAAGALARLQGTGTLRLRARRKVGRGSYRLALSGRLEDGARASQTFPIKVR